MESEIELNNQRRQPSKRKYKYYEILRIRRDASQEEIMRAYRKLAKDFHPDVNRATDANEKFKLINQAYSVLGDLKNRADYDASSAECPDCYTHEVVRAVEFIFRCRHCGRKFDVSPVSNIIKEVEGSTRYTLSKEICPNCGNKLYWDAELSLWRCQTRNCKRIYTFEDLHGTTPTDTEKEAVKIQLKSHRAVSQLIIIIAVLVVIMFILILWIMIGNQVGGLF